LDIFQDLLARAATALQQGNAALAEQLATQALQSSPRDFAGLHLLAIARFQTGKLMPALDAMQAAVQVNGSVAPAWSNLGGMQLAIGEKAQALASFERALALGPPRAELLCNCGNLLLEAGRIDEALQRFDAASALNPTLMPAWLGRANACLAREEGVEALRDCDRALSLAPANPVALNVRAACLLSLSRFDEALACAENSLAVRPGSASAFSNKASALLGLKRPGDALEACDQALALEARHAEALSNRGAALNALHRYAEALAACDAALAENPRLAEALINRVTPLRHAERYGEALASADQAVDAGAHGADAQRCRGIVLSDLGRHSEALASFDRAIARDPADAESLFDKAQLLLREGRFAEGLPLYEARKRLSTPFGARVFAAPLWLGTQDIAGKTLFVHSEQGLGDVIMFSRYVALLSAKGARVVLGVPERLAALFRSFTLDADIIAGDRQPDHFDFHVPIASLPLACGSRIDAIPAPIPYLRAEPARVLQWRQHLGEAGFKIGIAWQGARVSNDAGRSVPLSLFAGLAAVPGVRLISLQKGESGEQLSGLKVESPGTQFDSGPDAFLDTAAVMEVCDLVISTDTAVPHLAGALGRPVWIALRHSPEWRWFLSRNDSPWYPTASLFRQPAPGDWANVFGAMAERLRGMPIAQ
jgi:tetratricopeptide (TPR) repeat protein